MDGEKSRRRGALGMQESPIALVVGLSLRGSCGKRRTSRLRSRPNLLLAAQAVTLILWKRVFLGSVGDMSAAAAFRLRFGSGYPSTPI